MRFNTILSTDSYKASHWVQYPPGTERVYAYSESRGGIFDRTLFFGLQIWLKEYMSKPITQYDIDQAALLWGLHGEPFNRAGWQHILEKHGGYLPVYIKAVPEGLVIPNHNVLATIENTDPACYWLTSYLETQLLRALWYPTTVASISWHCKRMIKEVINKSSDDPGQIFFKLHDFGARGTSSRETAGIGGAAHLVNFDGTDTMEGILTAMEYYGAGMAGFSIPAAEHSTITSWGRDNEEAAYENMLKHFAKEGKIVAVVSDSYDLWNAVANMWGGSLKEAVQKSGATLVVRPDSGDPLTVPVKVIDLLAEKFGYTVNSKGYKVLPSCVRVIQGDGINVNSLPQIMDNILKAGYAIDNLAFGMGGGLLQHVNRDTFKFALKTSAAEVNGEWRDVYKDPVTDHGKMSKKGRLALITEKGEYQTVAAEGHNWQDIMVPVYRNGELLRDWTFEDVRMRSNY